MSINGQVMYEANFRRHLPVDKDAGVLDIGCGFGEFLAYLEAQGYSNLRGVETDPKRAAACRLKTAVPVDVTNALDTYLHARPNQYQLITLKSVIAHFPQDKLLVYLRAIRDALHETGRLIVETYNGSRWTSSYLLYNDLTHRQTFTEYSLREALEAAGLRVIALSGERLPITSPGLLAWQILQHLWIGCLKAIYFAERGRDRNPRIFSKYLIAVCQRAAAVEDALNQTVYAGGAPDGVP